MFLDCVKFQHFCGSPSLVVVNRSNVPLYCSSPISMTTSRRLRPKWILRSEEKAKYEVTKPELGKAVTGIQLALKTQGLLCQGCHSRCI